MEQDFLTAAAQYWVNITESLPCRLTTAGARLTNNFLLAQKFVANSPPWILIYVLLIVLSVFYVVNETVTRYRGVKWVLSHPVPPEVNEGMKEFILSDDKLREVMELLRREIDKGLNPSTKDSSSVKCFTTYVQDLPTGKEVGKYLALDLGGSNFRVLFVTLQGRYFSMKAKTFVISEETMTGTGEALFDYIAECLCKFIDENRLGNLKLPLGFTFSFPLKQVGLRVGILQRWTKGFTCSGVVGEDVALMLRKAIEKRGNLNVDVIGVLNDTTGTLMSCAWKNPNTKIGVILGTGTNACYVEKISNIPGFDGDSEKPFVLVNTEWGAFGDNGELAFLFTDTDTDVDKRTVNPGKQVYEKLISGMYLGEIVRIHLVKFINDKVLLKGNLTKEIEEPFTFGTKNISLIESEKRGVFNKCRRIMKKYAYTDVSEEDCNVVRYICECVSMRAAYLASAGLAVLMNKMGYSAITIGVDGTLYRLHPYFRKHMVKKISQLVDKEIMEFSLLLSSDGSGRGAALVAAACV